jgi:fructose-specific phosphotransferase system IIC component
MADYDVNSVPGLIRGVLDDTRTLIREELALARAEIREEVSAAQTVAIAFGAAAVGAVIGAVLLFVAIGGALAYVLTWPAWAGYGIVAVLLLGGTYGLVIYGRKRLASVRALPNTTETVKENLAWMQTKSATK